MAATNLLVTGASGQLGQRVLSHLLDTLSVPANTIIATTRKPSNMAPWAARGVVIRGADFDEGHSLARAFHGAGRMLLISTDADPHGHRVEQHRRAISAAQEAGIDHLIYTSMPDPIRSLVLFAPDHANTEAALAASSLPGWTILRNHWYFENVFMTLPRVLGQGRKWFSATGDGKSADISRDDLALAAACALAENASGKAIYTLSGCEALSTTEQAQMIGAAIGQTIQVIRATSELLIRGMLRAGLSEQLARLLLSFDANVSVGRMANVTGDFRRITGRTPRTFGDWLTANRAALLTA